MRHTSRAQWGAAIAVLVVVLVLALAWSVFWLVALTVLMITACAVAIWHITNGRGHHRS